MTDDARIGDFTRPVVTAPTASGSPVKDALENAERQIDAEVRKDEATLKPLLSYADRLREVGVTSAKAAEIIDAVLLKGHYGHEVTITKKIRAHLRTRNARDTRRAQELIEGQRLTYDRHYNELMGRFLLAASLESFGGDRLEHTARGAKPDDVERAFTSRLAYVENLSEPALKILFTKLFEFDHMIAVVLEEGAIENF